MRHYIAFHCFTCLVDLYCTVQTWVLLHRQLLLFGNGSNGSCCDSRLIVLLLNRRLARLDKKNDDRLTLYYKDFIAMCRRVCGRPLEEDKDRGANVEPISEERASRCLFRVQLLSKIRDEVQSYTNFFYTDFFN
jgi:hypothetical protein